MTANMKQLEVEIMGQHYLLGCPEGGEARLMEAVASVDVAMCKIRDAGKVRARDRIAVLAALNLAFDLHDKEVDRSDVPESGSSIPTPSISPQDAQDWSSIVARIDSVLGEDGQLL